MSQGLGAEPELARADYFPKVRAELLSIPIPLATKRAEELRASRYFLRAGARAALSFDPAPDPCSCVCILHWKCYLAQSALQNASSLAALVKLNGDDFTHVTMLLHTKTGIFRESKIRQR